MNNKIKFILGGFLATLVYALSIYLIDRFNIFYLGNPDTIYNSTKFIGQLLFFWLFMYFLLQYLSKKKKVKGQSNWFLL